MSEPFMGTSIRRLYWSIGLAAVIIVLIVLAIINSRHQEIANKPSPASIKPQILPLDPSQLDELVKTLTPSASAKPALTQNQKQELLHYLTPSPQAKPALTDQELETIFNKR